MSARLRLVRRATPKPPRIVPRDPLPFNDWWFALEVVAARITIAALYWFWVIARPTASVTNRAMRPPTAFRRTTVASGGNGVPGVPTREARATRPLSYALLAPLPGVATAAAR